MSYHDFGYVKPSPPDSRDLVFETARQVLPSAFDLGPYSPHIKDQGQEGSCTGFSLSSARESLMLKSGAGRDFSPAFIYYEERRIEKDTAQDAGASIRDGLATLKHKGVAPEEAFPYVVGGYAAAPGIDAYKAALGFKIAVYHRITSIHGIKAALAITKQPVVLGISVYEGMEKSADGYIPMPASGEQSLGGHAILCTGYWDDNQVAGGGWLRLNNSWGTGAGSQGHYFLPYAYLAATQWSEMWTLS